MKNMWTSLKKNRFLFLFIGIIFVFGVLSGVFFYFKQDASIKDMILGSLNELFQVNVFSYQNLLYHFLVLFVLLLLLFCFIGLPLLVAYIFLEGLSVGFLIPIFFASFKFHFIMYFFCYFILIKFVYILLLFLFFLKSVKFVKKYFCCLKAKKFDMRFDVKLMGFILLLFVLNDLFVYFFSNRILIFLLG